MKLDLSQNSKRIKDLSGRPETVKLLEENIKKKLLGIGLDDDFLDLTLQSMNK